MNECITWIDKTSQDLILESQKKKDTTSECIAWLTREIRELIPQEAPTLKVVMEFLQDVAKACCKAGNPIVWTTPSGFKVVLDEVNTRSRQIRTQLFGTLIQLTYKEIVIPPVYNVHDQAGGIAANFIHSLDASAMVLCVNEALSQGIGSFRMIHDGFATVPGDMKGFNKCIRNGFIEMYSGKNLLKALVEEALEKDHPLTKNLPPQGSLELERLISASYFFA